VSRRAKSVRMPEAIAALACNKRVMSFPLMVTFCRARPRAAMNS
jgi:hypothetical protein